MNIWLDCQKAIPQDRLLQTLNRGVKWITVHDWSTLTKLGKTVPTLHTRESQFGWIQGQAVCPREGIGLSSITIRCDYRRFGAETGSLIGTEFTLTVDMAFIHGESRAPASAEMTLEQTGEGTTVTWKMEGDLSGAFPPVLDGLMRPWMEGQIVDMFDRGLEKLSTRVLP